MDSKRIFKMRDIYISLSKRKRVARGRDRRGTETMFLSKQEVTRSGAQVERLDLPKTMGSPSKLTGEKAKYAGTGVGEWVDVMIRACGSSFLIASVFSGR